MRFAGLVCLLLICVTGGYAQPSEVSATKFVMNINGNPLKIPYFTNFSGEGAPEAFNRVVITIHGTNRDADSYFANMEEAAELRAEDSDSTLIIAPQFLTEDDIESFSLDPQHLFWSSGGWRVGSNSQSTNSNPRPERISSYAVLDSLLLNLVTSFPNLEYVVFAGHSAGGQLSNRFSGTSASSNILCSEYGISTRYIVANPSSYVYLDNLRRIAGTIDQFEVPDGSCPGYNEWGYGLEEPFEYPEAAGGDSIVARIGNREIIYLLGQVDNDPNSPSLDKSCEANLQGEHRLERGSIYFNYLKQFYGEEQSPLQQLDTVPFAGHSDRVMYTSDIGLFYLFESNPQTNCDEVTNTLEQNANLGLKVFPVPASDYLNVSEIRESGLLSIYSMDGRTILERQVQRGSSFQLDIRQLPPGPFVLEIRSGITAVRKLLIRQGSN